MRITFALPCYPWKPSGGFRVIYEYANHLVGRGHQVCVVHARRLRNVPRGDVRQWFRRKRNEVLDWFHTPEIQWQPVDKRVQLQYVPELVNRYLPESDAIFATHWATAEYVRDLSKEKGVKFYLVQDFYPWLASRETLEETWAWPLHKVTVSSWLSEIVRSSPSVWGTVGTIPIAIDHARFRLKKDIAARKRQVALMYSGAPYKACEDGLRALRDTTLSHPEVRVVCFGPHKFRRSDVPKWATGVWNISESGLVDLYNSSSVYVCSSMAEGFALPPAEAMACGCAVASTDCGGNREYAVADVTALISSPKDPASLASNVIRLLENDDLRIRIAKEGQKRIQAFTWERSTDLFETYIKECFLNEQLANGGKLHIGPDRATEASVIR